MLTKEVKMSIDESILCWLATVDKSGFPNCSPKEVFTYYKNTHLLIANIASPKSVANIKINPNVCVSFVHVFKQHGFKLNCIASYIDRDSVEYEEMFNIIEPMVGDVYPVKGIMKLCVKTLEPIKAPSYFLFPNIPEASKIESAKKIYGA